MTVLLPDDDTYFGTSAAPTSDPGAELVRPRAESGHAAVRADANSALAVAVRGLEDFARDLPAREDNPDAWPGLFDGETARLRGGIAAAVPDGPVRDGTGAEFDHFARAKAVETRVLAARHRIARNRDGLRRALDAYAGVAAEALSPAVAEFALSRGEAAIRTQAGEGILSPAEADGVAERFRADVAERRARQYVADDPDAAAREFSRADGGLFPEIPPERRAKLREEAVLRRAANREAEETAAIRDTWRAAAAALSRQTAFEAEFVDGLGGETASPLALAGALADGTIGVATAERLHRALVSHREALRRRADLAAATEARLSAGDALDPSDPDDAEAADAWIAAVVEGEQGIFERMGPGDWSRRIPLLRLAERRLGFRTGRVARLLDLYWSSGDPGLMGIAAAAEADDAASPERRDFSRLVEAGLAPAAAAERLAVRRPLGPTVPKPARSVQP